uniref:Metal-nicotianamine transporter YSL7 n=1 Tax=Nelumbo nucifera TaxID=4432 RepID=A0A822YWX1_NELNU|nr:TPA_asm: hypothetical protein HUJ06_006671 [Nelumbo nucifera]
MSRSGGIEEEWERRERSGLEIEKKAVVENDNSSSKEASTEKAFENEIVPSWKEQLTFRAFLASAVLSVAFCFIVMKLSLTTGIIPSLNVAAGLLGFFFIRVYSFALQKFGLLKQPFSRQENTVIQTAVVAASGIAFSSGYGSYILGMMPKIASQAEDGNTVNNMKPLSLGWMYGFVFAVSFVGLFSIVPLRKIMIIDYKLTYPSGTATAFLINSFHTSKGAKLAKKQVNKLFEWFSMSFLWAFFQWFFTSSDGCGFSSFPTFGLQAFNKRLYFDFSATYVGVGMICPYIVNVSLLVGAILSWLIMWPLIEQKKGIWYAADISGIFISIAMILGDGLFHVVCMLITTGWSLMRQYKKRDSSSVVAIAGDQPSSDSTHDREESYDDQRRKDMFLKDQIPMWVAGLGYVSLSAISIVAVPQIFHQIKWYHILVSYIIAPILAFCNSYGCGLTDWSLASTYGKIAIFIIGSWVGLHGGGIVAGLVACGVMMSIVSTASDLMQDFKTGYLTLASPRAMFCSQVMGTALGCLIAPAVFWFYYKSYPTLGEVDGSFPAPYGLMYRGIAILGVEGTSSLPRHCVELSVGFFCIAIALNIVTLLLEKYDKKWRLHRFVPRAMCMAIPFYLGGYFAIDMCIGSLILYLWRWKNKAGADALAPAVASGMICGDSLWGIPAAILSLANVNPPLCMKFLPASANAKVDAFLNG